VRHPQRGEYAERREEQVLRARQPGQQVEREAVIGGDCFFQRVLACEKSRFAGILPELSVSQRT
jgi:hypothetical protein